MSSPLLRRIPLALTALRALLAPVLVWLALYFPVPGLFGLGLVLALVSDFLDGVLARRWGVATTGLRRLDSIADSLFYAAALFAAWHLYPSVVRSHLPELVVLIALEVARYVFDLAKFGREASYHMWTSKLWGLLLFAGFFSLLALDVPGLAFTLAIYAGIVADLEGLAISIVLPEWRTDVPSFVHALRVRGRDTNAGPPRTAGVLPHLAGAILVLGALVHLAIPLGGPDWYAFFGAPPRLVDMARAGALRPVLTCLVIASVLGVLATYVYSGMGYLARLPLLRTVLLLAGVGLLCRGLVFVPLAYWRPESLAALCGDCGRVNLFLILTSAVCLLAGAGMLVAGVRVRGRE